MTPHLTHIKPRAGSLRRSPHATVVTLLTTLFGTHPRQPVIIAVGGPGGTGKTTLCTNLAPLIPGAAVLSLDEYKTPRRERAARELFGPHPDANRIELIREHLGLLRSGQSIDVPVYNRESGCAEETRSFSPTPFILLDGEIATYHHFRSYIDFSLFIDADWKTQLATRLSRDIELRGYSSEKALATFLQSNIREFGAWGAESKNWADIHLYCHDDYQLEIEGVSSQVYERCRDVLSPGHTRITLEGFMCSIPTPFAPDGGIDEASLALHLEWLYQNGTRRILLNGPHSERHSLSTHEQRQVMRVARYAYAGLIIGTIECRGVPETVARIEWAATRGGADAVVAVFPPTPFAVTAPGVEHFIESVISRTDIPVVWENLPTEQGLLLSMPPSPADTTLFPQRDGEHLPARFLMDELRFFSDHNEKRCGLVSGYAAVLPQLFSAFEQQVRGKRSPARDRFTADLRRACGQLLPPAEAIPYIKAAISRTLPGYPADVRLPLVGG